MVRNLIGIIYPVSFKTIAFSHFLFPCDSVYTDWKEFSVRVKPQVSLLYRHLTANALFRWLNLWSDLHGAKYDCSSACLKGHWGWKSLPSSAADHLHTRSSVDAAAWSATATALTVVHHSWRKILQSEADTLKTVFVVNDQLPYLIYVCTHRSS